MWDETHLLWSLHMVMSKVMRSATKNQFCVLSFTRLLVKLVVLQSQLQSICVLNKTNVKSNQQSLGTFCIFPLFFYPHEIFLIVTLVFIQLICNNTIRSVLQVKEM